MIKVATIEVYVDETSDDTEYCLNDFLSECSCNNCVTDGSIELKVNKDYSELKEFRRINS